MPSGCVVSVVHSKFSVITALVPLDLSLFILHLPFDLSSMRHPACDDCTSACIAVRVIPVWQPAHIPVWQPTHIPIWQPAHHDKNETPLRKYQKLYGRK